jgi:Tol biopolymer transport system component
MLEVNHSRVSAVIVAVALAAGALALVGTEPAEAAFPGANGKIAFSSNRVTASSPTGDYEIYTMDSGGTGVIQLTDNTADDIQPAWSSDGQRIAFATNRDGGNYEVYVMASDGNLQSRLTDNLGFDLSPTWSPDDQQIAFASDRDGDLEIFTMKPNGEKQVRRTRNTTVDADPAWSPDGARIAFASLRDGNYEIYTMSAGGAAPTNVSNNAAAVDLDPDWQPVP